MTQFKVDFNDFKRRDNTNLMEITLYKDNGEQITPNRDHQWSGKALKFGDGDKRLEQELVVTIDGDKIGVPSKQLENLPSGDYGLELWEVSNDSKTIYPSAGFVEFRIHRNADESLESVTPTIDIDKVIDDLHQAGLNVVVDDIEMLAPDATPSVTSEIRDGKNHIKLHVPRGLTGNVGPAPTLTIGTVTKLNPDQTPTANFSGDNGAYTLDLGIPQGSKGDTGNVDNTGLISAPAFQSLQTQVDNSAVGTNLISMANTTEGYIRESDGSISQASPALERTTDYIEVEPNKTYCMQEEVYLLVGQYLWFAVGIYDGNKAFLHAPVVYGSHATANGTDFKTLKIVMPENAKYVRASFSTYGNAKVKLEKGSVATDWSLNPSEILTQSDYAKIKAAIVALGGSLS